MQQLLNFGFLDGKHTVFDYGCGRGDDLRLLLDMGVPAAGWDPVFRPKAHRSLADVVNLGFVLNVIEDAEERRRALEDAFSLTRKVLAVSVMLGYQRRREQFAAYRDGVRTRRNTFQKYFAQDEFREYVQTTLHANAIPVAPGTCLVFRDPIDEQLFLLARQQVRRHWRLLRRQPDTDGIAQIVKSHRAPIDAYWVKTLELGRPPAPSECPEAQTLTHLTGSWRRVHGWVSRFFHEDELEAAALGRQEDLLVYFALGLFERRKPYRELPDGLQRDVHFFFGNITKARSAGKRVLFAAGDDARVQEAAVFCHAELGIGTLFERHHLVFHQSMLSQCLPLIRVYVGCALQLFGDVNAVDLIKVHLQSSKVTFLVYDDFERASNPKLIERIKVDLSRLRVDFFDYSRNATPQALEHARDAYFQR